MRVSLWVDMEGTSLITDHRECWPAFPQYWKSGRAKLTRDVAAAARGLMEGGASDVVVVNAHGLGWPNILIDELPRGARMSDDSAWRDDFDATFHVGFHARAGTPNGFVSHTMVPRFNVAMNGKPVTENHIWAWLVGTPLIGVVGDEALGGQLDGALEETPFLAVKRSTSRDKTTPLHADAESSADAIREFARACAESSPPQTPHLPASFSVAFDLDSPLADRAVGRHGLKVGGPGVLALQAEDWSRDAQPGLEAAMGAALYPLVDLLKDLDLSSEPSMRREKHPSLDRLRRYFIGWVHE